MNTPKPRVLIVCQHFWPESFRINDISNYLIEKDYEVDVLCGKPNYPKGSFLPGYSYFKPHQETHNGATLYRTFEIPRGNNTNTRIFLNYLSFPIASLFHIPKLLTKKYDKILIYQLSPVMMAIAGIILGKLKHVETTMYVLDLWPENLFSVLPIKNKILNKLATSISHWHYRHVDKLVALSETMKAQLVSVTKISNTRITVLPQACEKEYEIEKSDKDIQNKFRKDKMFNILFTGNLSPAQSLGTMLDAAKILQTRGITDVRWVVVGDGMSRKSFEKEIKEAKLEKNFVFEGFKPLTDIPKYANVADALVGCLVKSDLLDATIPAKVMSYLALGRPVLLAMDGEARDLINKKARCGFACETEDADALAKNIIALRAMSAPERKAMGKRGKEYHLAHFERNLILDKLVAFMFK